MAYDPNIPLSLLAGTTDNTANALLTTAAGIGPGYAIRTVGSSLTATIGNESVFEVNGATTAHVQINTTTTGTFKFEGTINGTDWVKVEVFNHSNDINVTNVPIVPVQGSTYHILCNGFVRLRLLVVTTLGRTITYDVVRTIDQDVVDALLTGPAPHSIGYPQIHKDVEYTTAQTGVSIWTPATGYKFVITDITIATGGTTAGIVTLWQGGAVDLTYSPGVDNAIFRGEFAPSTNNKPGVVKTFQFPYISTTVDHQLKITTSADMTVYIQVNGYEIQA